LGNLARSVLLPGQRHDSIGVEPLIAGIEFDALIADKAFDNDALRATLKERSAAAVIPAKENRKAPIPLDAATPRCTNGGISSRSFSSG
jgi:Transposase DDE domain